MEPVARMLRRRGMLPGRLLRGVAAALAVAGGSAPATTSVASPSPTHPVIELDGALRAVPASGQVPGVKASRALEVLALQGVTVTADDPPVLARVTWSATTASSGPAGPLPEQGALAWVLMFHTPEPAPACPVFSPDPIPPGGVSRADAVIVNATTGAAAVHTGRHAFCGRWTTPLIAPARRYWSVPWTQAGPTTVKVTLPPCGIVSGSGTSNDQMSVIAAAPLDTSCDSPSTTTITSDITSTDWKHLTHAPVGLVCSQPAPGLPDVSVDLPPVPGCVSLP